MKTWNLDTGFEATPMTATEAVHQIKPLHPTLEDELADLRVVAFRAQRREVEAVRLLEKLTHHFKDYEQDGPGHFHSRPGHWDKDGSKCEWCETWRQIKHLTRP